MLFAALFRIDIANELFYNSEGTVSRARAGAAPNALDQCTSCLPKLSPPARHTRGAFTMTSQERVLASCNHHEPDRIPIDLSGHRSSGMAAIAYARLRDYLGLPKKPIRVYDPIQQLAIIDDDVLDRFSVDV